MHFRVFYPTVTPPDEQRAVELIVKEIMSTIARMYRDERAIQPYIGTKRSWLWHLDVLMRHYRGRQYDTSHT